MSYIRSFSFYQTADPSNPLSWGAVRENIEQASNRDFLKQTSRLGPNAITKIRNLFLRKPSTAEKDYRPGDTRSGSIERPGFLQGSD